MVKNPKNYVWLDLRCSHDCSFRIHVPNPNTITDEDFDLLGKVYYPDFMPNDNEVARIHALLGGKDWRCPVHKQNRLIFESVRLPEPE